MTGAFAFVLNLDGERELAQRRPIDPFRALEDRPQARGALDALVAGARVIGRRDVTSRTAVGCVGLAFMATPSALDALREAGAVPAAAPSIEVLARVNHRQFAYAIDDAGGAFRCVTTHDDALRELGRPSPTGAWLVKRPYGFAGRGRLIVEAINDKVTRSIARILDEEGAVAIEPLFRRTADFAVHGYLSRTFDLTAGRPTIADVDAGGVFRGARIASTEDLDDSETRALQKALRSVAGALVDAGYFGPFGVDAYRCASGDSPRFIALGEINARYTMGWATGMGPCRPDFAPR